MKWITTGRQLGQAVRNVQRLREILAIFARHGFADILDRMDLGKYLPRRLAKRYPQDASTPERLRKAFEELGPTFVKLGQVLSTRPDLLPESFIEELVKLQDNVQTIPYAEIQKIIEKELKQTPDKAFRSITEKPLASASIAQVHAAILHSGEEVVLKVQRPGIEDTIKQDISLLAFLAQLLEKYVPETRIANPTVIVDEFFRTLTFELDFVIEANNIAKIAGNMKAIPDVVLPKVYKEYSSSRVLTQEKLKGIPANDVNAIEVAGIDRKKIVETGARFFFRSVMIDGLFHGDLHGGNLFVLPKNRIGIIDFGIVGRLSHKSRDQLAEMFMALLTEDYETLCYIYADLGSGTAGIDFPAFQRDVRNAISPYMGLNINEVNSGRVFIEGTKIAAKYNVQVPGDWMLVFKAILTMEGMGRTLDPNFDMLSLGKELAKELIKNQYSLERLGKEAFWILKDLSSLFQVLPRQIKWMFKKFNQDDFAFEIKIPELNHIRKTMELNGRRTGLGIVSAGFFVASSVALQYSTDATIAGYPTAAVVFFTFGVFALVRFIFT